MNRRMFVRLVGVVLLALGSLPGPEARAQETKKAERRPNVLVILSDDQGYADLGCQGCRDIPTPHIDSIARNGVRFTDGYVSCTVCSPSRAGILTGRYQERFGHEFNPANEQSHIFGLPVTEVTLADRLKAAGYATGAVGKWHLGFNDEYHPLKRGFDEFFGFLGGSHEYLDPKATLDMVVFKIPPPPNQKPPKPLGALNAMRRGTKIIREMDYLTDAFTREAVSFIDRHKDGPFFLYLAYNAVHAPLQAPRKYTDRFPQITDPKRHVYAGMLAALDDGVGAVLDKLKQEKLEEDTLIFFLSDNGGPTEVTTSRNDPLRGVKTEMLEGGIRIPFMVQWKGHLPAGKVYRRPVIALDIFPTALAAAGSRPPAKPPLDGVDLLPYLNGQEEKPPHDVLYWRMGKQWAIRKGDWKLVKTPAGTQLYNLPEDVGEKTDLAGRKPDLVRELDAALRDWDRQLARPLWMR